MIENSLFSISALIITLAAIFGYFNYRFLKLPTTIGLVIIAFTVSLTIVFFDLIFPQYKIGESINGKFLNIDFHEVVMEGALCFLLFAGALHIDFNLLIKKRYAILSLATLSIIISTILIGLGIFYIGQFIGLNIPIIFSLLFGALISPTDPVAVLSLLKSMKNVPDTLRVKIAGESLFNDGVGIVLFAVILNIAISSSTNTGIDLNYFKILEFFFLETFGGIAPGTYNRLYCLQSFKKK
jgi:NhaP-type Na+/H+ and K+/H+ antiporters